LTRLHISFIAATVGRWHHRVDEDRRGPARDRDAHAEQYDPKRYHARADLQTVRSIENGDTPRIPPQTKRLHRERHEQGKFRGQSVKSEIGGFHRRGEKPPIA
jgi:hypothetical protein